jgi:Na+/H+-dicarboxylate symporter
MEFKENHDPAPPQPGLYGHWKRIPLYLRIVAAMALGMIVGAVMGNLAAGGGGQVSHYLLDIGKLILRLLSMIALPLIFVAIIHSLLAANVGAATAKRLATILITNTVVAIAIGLLVANLLQPGSYASIIHPTGQVMPDLDLWDELKKKIPESFFGSLVPNWDNGRQDIIPAILIALGLGVAMRRVRERNALSGNTDGIRAIAELFETFYGILLAALEWIVDLVPLAVFGIGRLRSRGVDGTVPAGLLLPGAGPAAILGTTGRLPARRQRGFAHRVLHRQFHRQRTVELQVPQGKNRPAGRVCGDGRPGRQQLQQ